MRGLIGNLVYDTNSKYASKIYQYENSGGEQVELYKTVNERFFTVVDNTPTNQERYSTVKKVVVGDKIILECDLNSEVEELRQRNEIDILLKYFSGYVRMA